MNQTSNTSGTTHTTITLLDDIGSSSICGSSVLSSGDELQNSNSSTPSVMSNISERSLTSESNNTNSRSLRIFNYKLDSFVSYCHLSAATCEEICLDFCRSNNILPITRFLFGICVYDTETEWAVPCKPLRQGIRYCFRMRFKFPALDTELKSLDNSAYEYLYRQMRHDRIHECISEIRYPAKKDNVMGLGVVDMCIDYREQININTTEDRVTIGERIEANYKRYLPRQLVKKHIFFVKKRICKSFRQCKDKSVTLDQLKQYYVQGFHELVSDYLMEVYSAIVDYIPNEDQTLIENGKTNVHVYIKLDLYDSIEPGLKVSRMVKRDKLNWIHVGNLEDIYALCTGDKAVAHLEINGFPKGYKMQFEKQTELESFVTYLAGYVRLTSKWSVDLCVQYWTPSLRELNKLCCHGPIGGSFSFAKIREKRNECGSYIIRQCEKEYDTYYIDINTKFFGQEVKKYKTETFKIKNENDSKWILHYNEKLVTFERLIDLALYIPTDSDQKIRIPPSEYDKAPFLLICLPKNMQLKKTELKINESELLLRPPLLMNPKVDLQWYKNSLRECDNGKMVEMQADWLQGSFKEVCVRLKVLKSDTDDKKFLSLVNTWSKIYSPHIIKLYGITIASPYTMVMEYPKYGSLNNFLMKHKEKVSVLSLLEVVYDLVRGIVYLQGFRIQHGFIRCANLLVTNFEPKKKNQIQAKIADPGLPRSYTAEDLPWIPFEYYKDMDASKLDPYAEPWAFATTIWEIYARGKPLVNYTAEKLHENYNRCGAILNLPSDDCHEMMYQTMMDGWSTEPDKRFNHHDIFFRLAVIKEYLQSNYTPVKCAMDSFLDTSSQNIEFNNVEEEDFHCFKNGNSASDIQSCTFSSNSTTCDRAPLINTQNSHNVHQQQNLLQINGAFGINRFAYPSYFDETQVVLQLPNGSKVIYKEQIGEGHYGTVYLGHIYYKPLNLNETSKCEKVAIKTLKSMRPTQFKTDDAMREIKIMQTLNHPNIVKIILWVEKPLSIIMEYLESGSFIVYLSSRKPNLTDETLLHFAHNIADGMKYLCHKNIIHRDLAARNILVDHGRVKISDFGLAQIANSDGYYYAKSNREIPIKWYSPESLKTEKFSFQSDVWSYGVTLYEMFSRGETPNLDMEKELKQEEFLNRLENGDRLRKHELCPDIVYEKLMLPCWHGNPKERPTFEELLQKITSIREENGEIIQNNIIKVNNVKSH